MRVGIVSGIWPPDVGGPASHAPDLASFLHDKGHRVEVLVTADRAPEPEAYPVRFVSRRLPPGLRHAEVIRAVIAMSGRAEVIYATSMIGRAATATTLRRRPLVVKLVADQAYERARRRGLFEGTLEEFQAYEGGWQLATLRAARNRTLSRAADVLCPSNYLARLAVAWGVAPDKVRVLPNPSPDISSVPGRAAARAALELTGPSLAFVGRITRQKSLEVALDALAAVPGPVLLVAGDGPELEAVQRRAQALGLDGRVRFLGAVPRLQALGLLRAVDASILSSSWENFPHSVVESLAVGTPVVTTAAGGVAEVVQNDINGLIVPVGDEDAFAAALSRLLTDPGLLERLRLHAAPSVEHLSRERVYGEIEELLLGATRPS